LLAIADTITGRVVKITDGDTVHVLDSTQERHKIRLQGIDAPERKQAFGKRSKEYLSDFVAGEPHAQFGGRGGRESFPTPILDPSRTFSK
jgi:endonuclease YncB( thermonuclease family)